MFSKSMSRVNYGPDFFWAESQNSVPDQHKTAQSHFMASKLYTTTVIMQFYGKGELSLDNPMSKYLPLELIQGIHV
jgi:hypothetical protein